MSDDVQRKLTLTNEHMPPGYWLEYGAITRDFHLMRAIGNRPEGIQETKCIATVHDLDSFTLMLNATIRMILDMPEVEP
jgi:hypothetical protein